MSKQLSRRGFLKAGTALLATDPILSVVEKIIGRALFPEAFAETNGARYVAITQSGAPPRWVFDLLLNPGNAGNFVPNPYVGTVYSESGGRYTDVAHQLVNINGLWVPPLWGYSLPAPGGGTRTLAPLLNHLVHLRGINTANAGHAFCQRLHFQPLGALSTVTALTADGGSAPVPGVNIRSANYQFLSRVGHTSVDLSGGNLLNSLLLPFQQSGSNGYRAGYQSLKSEIHGVLRELDILTSGSSGMSDQAIAVIEQQTEDLTAVWAQLRGKYQDLVDRAIRGTYPGVTDKPIGTTGSRNLDYQQQQKIVPNGDLRTMIQSNTSLQNMADHFAAVEFILTRDLSRSIAMDAGRIFRLNSPSSSHQLDEHETGKMVSLLLNTLEFAALGSCLLELVAVLEAGNLFDKTVIDLAGEFNREPKNDGSGSDHGWQGASVALFSGLIQNPIILGDIVADPGRATYGGTWGFGATDPALLGTVGSDHLTVGHFASTLAMLLGAPSPVTAAPSLLTPQNSTFVPILPQGKLV